MEADLRVTRKTLEQAETELVELREERGELRAELDECRDELNQSTSKFSELRTHLQEECEKVQLKIEPAATGEEKGELLPETLKNLYDLLEKTFGKR